MNKQFMRSKLWIKQPKQSLDTYPTNPEEPHVAHYLNTVQYNHHRFFLDNEIDSSEKYRDLIQTLISAQEGDCVELVISNGGGYLETCMNIISAIRESQANVRAVVTGSCHSAASFITLACHEVAILDYCTMMVHTASFGTSGKASEIGSHVQHMNKYVENIIHDIYYGFLTEYEIQKLLSGVDFWFDAEEIRRRLEVRAAIFEKDKKKILKEIKRLRKEAEKATEEETEEVQDKIIKKSSKTSKKDLTTKDSDV